MNTSTNFSHLFLDYCTQTAPVTLKQKRVLKASFQELHPEITESADQAFQETAEKIRGYLHELFETYAQNGINESQLAAVGGEARIALIKNKKVLQQKIQSTRRHLIDLIIPPLSHKELEEEEEYSQEEISQRKEQQKRIDEESDRIVSWLQEKKEAIAAAIQVNYPLFKKEQQTKLVQKYRCSLPFPADESLLEAVFQECVKEEALIEAIRKDLALIFSLSSLSDDQFINQIKLSHTRETPFCATLETEDVVMGYSLYKLCHSLDIENIRHYNGQREFSLNLTQLDALHRHLRYMIETIKMFTSLLQGIVGGEEGQYFELGKKKISEAIRDQEEYNAGKKFYEKNTTDRIGISPTALAEIKAFQAGKEPLYFYLFSQISLKLDDHPQREEIKALFEKWYRDEGMKSLNGRDKTFQFDDPYRSVLDPLQISQIAPRMSVHLLGLRLFKNGVHSLEETLKESFLRMADQIAPSLVPSLEAGWAANWKEIESDVIQEHLSLSREMLVSKVDLYQARLYKQFVIKYLKLKSQSLESIYNPSEEEIEALYGKDKERVYSGQKHKNVQKLFEKLRSALHISTRSEKKSPLFKDYAAVIDELEGELLARLHEYKTLARKGAYGQERVDEAICCFERYVAMIVYRERSKISDESIEKSLIGGAAVVDTGNKHRDLRSRCGSGLVGRFLVLPGLLFSSLDHDLVDCLQQFKLNCLDGAFEKEELNNSESAMHVNRKEWIASAFGLRHANGPVFQHEPLIRKMVDRCHAASLFQEAMEFFCSNFYALSKEKRPQDETLGEECYPILERLKMGKDKDECDRKFRKSGDRQLEFDFLRFKIELPQHLIVYLVEKGILALKETADQGLPNCVVDFSQEGKWSQKADLSTLLKGGFGKIADDLAKKSDPLEAQLKKTLEGHESFAGWMNH